MPNALLKLVVVLITALYLSACVTTQTGGFGDKKDPKKAIQYSVEAARNYLEEGRWEDAKRNLKVALDIDENSAPANEVLALVFWRTGEYAQADKHFRIAVSYADDSDISRIRNNYAAFLFDQKRYEDAEGQLEKVAADVLYSGRPEAFINLGKVRIKLKKYAAAKEVLEHAYLMERGNPVIMFQLAEVYFQLGDYPKSQSFYDGYRKQIEAPSAASLWLGIRLANRTGDKDASASYALALRNLFPQSEEYVEYKSVYGDAGTEK